MTLQSVPAAMAVNLTLFDGPRCPVCSGLIPAHVGRGRPRTFCSPACGIAARYRASVVSTHERVTNSLALVDRNTAVVAAIRSGRTATDVAREHGISRERARQIFTRETRSAVPRQGTLCDLCGVRFQRTDASGDADMAAHRKDPTHVAALDTRRKRRQIAAVARFWSQVDKDGPVPSFAPHLGPCWIWTGAVLRTAGDTAYGRGTLRLERNGRLRVERFAHRAAYRLVVGPIPDGAELDHLCRVTLCVNPAHLDAVSHQENVRRGKNGVLRHLHAPAPRRTHCMRGHERTPDNLYPNRQCRPCALARYQRRKVAAA